MNISACLKSPAQLRRLSRALLLGTAYLVSLMAMTARAAEVPDTNAPSPLTTIAAVRGLSTETARRKLPVRVEAVVTFHDPIGSYLFVQDETAGIYVYNAQPAGIKLPTGQFVRLTGTTWHGEFAPVIADPTVEVLGMRPLPPPRPVTAEGLQTGSLDGQWVELSGIVNSLSVYGANQSLEINVAGLVENFTAHVPGFTTNTARPDWLVDARVRIRGTAGTVFNKQRQALGFQMFVPALDALDVVRPAPADPFAAPARPIRALLQFEASTPPGHRFKVAGTVTLRWNDRQIYLQDESGGVSVELSAPCTAQPGDRVEVVGFPKAGNFSPKLRYAVWRKIGDGPPVVAARRTPKEVRKGEADSQLVQLEGVLASGANQDTRRVLTLQDGDWSFEAHLKTNLVTRALTALQPGSRLRVTGVCEVQMSEREKPSGFRLLLRSPGDVVLLAAPPWWTVPRALAVLGLVTLAGGGLLLFFSQRVSWLQRKYSRLFANASDLVYVLDPQGRVTALNRAGEKITGHTFAEARGRPFAEWVAPEHRETFQAWWNAVLAGGQPPNPEVNLKTREGGEVVLEISGRLLRRRGQPVEVEGIARDITARKQAEAQRLLMERRMLDSQKLESIGVLAGGIAHDFNNLLTAILGNASLAALATPASSAQRTYLQNIEKTSSQAADLCKQLLAYSGRGRFIIQRLDLNAVIEDMRQLLQLSISKKAVLEIDAAPKLPAVEADPTQIRQVLMNMVINASEALGDKNGSIRIRTGLQHADAASLAGAYPSGDLPPGPYVFFDVTDTGCGMDGETISRIFDPFFTTKFTGRGLGLAAVSGIVRAHLGALRITSEPGRGSTFRVLLPSCEAPADPIAPPVPASPKWRGSGTVLLADDEAAVRAVTSQMLKSFGFDVLPAVNGQEAITLFREHAGKIVAVILDLTMPHLSGEEALAEIRARQPDARVLVVSGFSDQDTLKRVGAQVGNNFLAKPFKPDELREKMQALLAVAGNGEKSTAAASARR